ncbi:MAG: sugar phosphate isomerase/epimerase family protein, partial [Planctomycetia bacterium]
RGQNLSLPQLIDLAADAGYDGIEPWIGEIDKHVADGGALADAAKRMSDRGLKMESAIGFAEWIVDDDAKRAKGLDEAKRCMDLVAKLGGRRLAAPPAGATQQADLDLLRAAERYAALCEVGEKHDVVPMVEVWGFSKTLNRLGQAALVALESGHPLACILADAYHLYKGGSDAAYWPLLAGGKMHVFHLNDYPNLPRETITDADRVYPGDGVAPLVTLLKTFTAMGYDGVLSLELFNRDYWKQPAALVAKTGLEKMKAVVAAATA